MAKYRIGCIGVGGIAKWLQIPGTIKSPDLELVALCDIDQEVLDAAAKEYSICKSRCFTNYNDLVNCYEVDAVCIATPNDTHFPMAMAAVKAGKPYLLEKPITLNGQEADELAEATIKHDIKNMVNLSKRFISAARYARDLVRSGKLGQIYHIDVQYFHSWGLPAKEVGFVWRFDINKSGPGGCLSDLGSHCIDYIRFITGEEFVNVVGRADTIVKERPRLEGGMGKVEVDDYCIFHAGISGGASAIIHISNVAYGRNDYQRVEIYGSEGSLIYQNNAGDGRGGELEICIGEEYANGRIFTKLPIPGQYESDQMQSFADILNDCGDGLAATIIDGQKNQHVIDKVLISLETKGWVDI